MFPWRVFAEANRRRRVHFLFKMILNKKSVRIANPNCLNINNKTHTKLNRGSHTNTHCCGLSPAQDGSAHKPSCEDQTFRTFGLGQNRAMAVRDSRTSMRHSDQSIFWLSRVVVLTLLVHPKPSRSHETHLFPSAHRHRRTQQEVHVHVL